MKRLSAIFSKSLSMNLNFQRFLVLFTAILCLGLVACIPESDSETKANTETLIINKSDGGEIAYQVEIANTDDTRRLGLMYREYMAESEGMLLDFDKPRNASIWMKNTYIPLDLIFIDPKGKIVYLHKDAIPHDETSISSGRIVKSVLEVNANQIEKHGMKTGDTVIHSIYGTDN
jgi:uncharacterized membrane protein (UPF0127 family)